MKENSDTAGSAREHAPPDLGHQPLWIKIAALIVAIGALVALGVLYVYRLGEG